jgi:WD40 repeat protein
MKEAALFKAHDNYVLDLRITKDSKTLVSIGMDSAIKTWSIPDWAHQATFAGHDNSVNSLALSPDESRLVTGSTDNTLRIWSFPDGQLLHTLQDRKKVVAGVSVSSDGEWAAAASYGGRAAIWTLDGEPVAAFKANGKNLSSAVISPDKQMLATSGHGDTIELWSLPDGEHLRTLEGHSLAVGSLRFLDGGAVLVSMGYEQSIRFWDTQSWQAVVRHPEKPGVRGIAFSPDESMAAMNGESRVEIFKVDDWEFVAELPISTKSVTGLAFSPDGHWLAIGGADKQIRVWDLKG